MTKLNRFLTKKEIQKRAQCIASIMEQEECRGVVACSGDLVNVPACYLASKKLSIDFYLYMFDWFAYQWFESWERTFARRTESTLASQATGIIVTNEFMRDELHRRYGVQSTIVRNPCLIFDYDNPAKKHSQSSEKRIVFTGAIGLPHIDAFRNLLLAIKILNRDDIKLHVYTKWIPKEIISLGSEFIVHHTYQSSHHVSAVHSAADVLFLPLAFTSPYPEVIRTSSPGKIGEYLAAGTPILVHAPSDSFIAWFFRKHRCGLVVDVNDPRELSRSIARILTDDSVRESLSKQAKDMAKALFSVEDSRRAFAELLDLHGNQANIN